MADISKDTKKLLFGMGIKWHAIVSRVLYCIGIVCLVLGIVAAHTGEILRLSATHWLLTAIAFIVFALSAWQTAYHAAREGFEK